ncbi:hypothetical protein O3M35_012680 [Rhynocoris fuscipes]|uniref:Uncharacterized protein n=1 Tax=Rhynocoris fuscipes TaxID=488301 RepID=A0AAW1CZN2_9HEMI
MSCLKLDIVSLVERLGGAAKYQLLPGVYLSHHLDTSKAPRSLVDSLVKGNYSKDVDVYISNKVNEYLNSLTLSVKVLDTTTINHARKLSEKILSNFMPIETGRRKGYGGALWAAGSVAAVGLSVLAAISGKALMTSLLALMLAGTGAMRGGGAMGGGGGGGNGGCKSAAVYDHGRTIELDRLATAESNVYKEIRPVYKPEGYIVTAH